MTVSVVWQEKHFDDLRAFVLSHPEGRERVAFLLFGTVRDAAGTLVRFTSHGVFPIEDQHLVSNSAGHVTWDNSLVIPYLKRAKAEGLVFGIAHSHIGVPAEFSSIDDEGESGLTELIQHRNGEGGLLASFVLSTDGGLNGRIWYSMSRHVAVERIQAIGKRFQALRLPFVDAQNEAFQRQALAFGPALQGILKQLAVVVVGCGGTGSAIAMLLARLGVGEIVLIDPDRVEVSNLNRLHGAGLEDARSRRAKVETVRDSIEHMGLGTHVETHMTRVSDPSTWDSLKSADVIFGCTDDNLGRVLLNRLAYFYVVPVIDVGLAIEVTNDDPPKIVALDGRVTVLYPRSTCLLCREIVDVVRAREEALRLSNPAEYERQKEEAYVIGEGDPAPSVVTFTTEVATMAITEMLQRIQGFRGQVGASDSRTRQFHRMHDLRPGDLPKLDCPICRDADYWGRGDLDPFLDQVW